MIPIDPLTKGKLTLPKPLFTRYQVEPENERMRRKMAQRRLVWKIEPFQSAWRAEALEGRQRSSSEPWLHAAIAQHRVALAQYLVTLTNGEGTTHPSTCTAPSASPSSGVVSLLLAISGACWADDATSNPSEGSLELPTITNTTSIARVSRQRIMQYNYTGYLRSSPSP